MRKLILTLAGRDNWDRPVYESDEKYFVDVDPRKSRKPDICTKQGNQFNGEPDISLADLKEFENAEIEFVPARDTWDF